MNFMEFLYNKNIYFLLQVLYVLTEDSWNRYCVHWMEVLTDRFYNNIFNPDSVKHAIWNLILAKEIIIFIVIAIPTTTKTVLKTEIQVSVNQLPLK